MKLPIAAFTLVGLASSFSFSIGSSGPRAYAADMGETTADRAADRGIRQRPGMAGHAGTDVMHVQQALKDKGFDTGRVDGVIGKKTRSALKEFQKEQGLNTSGTLDAPTLAALGVTSSSQSAGQVAGQTGETSPDTDETRSMSREHSGGMSGDTSSRTHEHSPQARGGSPTPSYGAAGTAGEMDTDSTAAGGDSRSDTTDSGSSSGGGTTSSSGGGSSSG